MIFMKEDFKLIDRLIISKIKHKMSKREVDQI